MNWRVMRAMHTLYTDGRVRKSTTLLKDPQVKFLLNSTSEIIEEREFLRSTPSFYDTYVKAHLKQYKDYKQFLESEELLRPQTRFEDYDIKALMDIRLLMNSEELNFLRIQIQEAKEDIRGVSLMFFKNDKYLEKREALVNAVLKIMKLDSFPANKDQQYLYLLPVQSPRCIVLCENLYFLKLPALAKKNSIELWYAGGYNVEKIRDAPRRNLPIYYSCDWDQDGLSIYQKVKEIFPTITLLKPTGNPRGIRETEHKSKWDNYSSLDVDSQSSVFTKSESYLIRNLIENDQWIIEESNDLVQMVCNQEHYTS